MGHLALDARTRIDAVLAPACSADERARFWARFDARAHEAIGPLRTLYGDAAVEGEWFESLVELLASSLAARRRPLRDLDARREADPAWFQRNDQIGYVAYVDRFAGTLPGVKEHLDHLADLRVTMLHLMWVLRARPGASDGGYAVVDYGDVEPALGTWGDLCDLADILRDRGISLCLDVVMNHTAAEHPWATAARAGSARHREYYLTFPDRELPDAYERTLPEVFPEMAPGSFTWDADLQSWVWTTFNSYQWDLNYANPAVFAEMLGVMCGLANAGVEVLRLDAIAFTWKRMGTTCQNEPEAHLIAQAMRALLAVAAPAVLLLAEAIVAPTDLVPYLGAHERERRECHLAYHNQLMVMIWAALATGDARLATDALDALPATPRDASWLTYVRCHDDIGWAVDDAVAARAGLSGPAHRRFLAEWYRGDVVGSTATGAAFSPNPAIGDERTSGTTAALCGLSSARRAGDAAATDLAVRRLLLAYGIAFAFGGTPLVYMGDEVALDNDLTHLADPDRAEDSRWMHRPVMDWSIASKRTVPGTVEHEVFVGFRHLADVRRRLAALATGGSTWIHRLEAPSVLAIAREHPAHGRAYIVANVAATVATVPAAALGWAGLREPVDALGGTDARLDGDHLVIAPYGQAWFVDADVSDVVPTTRRSS